MRLALTTVAREPKALRTTRVAATAEYFCSTLGSTGNSARRSDHRERVLALSPRGFCDLKLLSSSTTGAPAHSWSSAPVGQKDLGQHVVDDAGRRVGEGAGFLTASSGGVAALSSGGAVAPSSLSEAPRPPALRFLTLLPLESGEERPASL